jgi:hypothetical protein
MAMPQGALMVPVTVQHHPRAGASGGYAAAHQGMLANPPGLITAHAMQRTLARQPQQHAIPVSYHYHQVSMQQAHPAQHLQPVVYVVQQHQVDPRRVLQGQVPGPPGLKQSRY